MVASQFDWTAPLMVLGLFVAMFVIFLYAQKCDPKVNLRRRLQANGTFRRVAKGVHDALPFGVRRLAFTLWNIEILSKPRFVGIYKSFEEFSNPTYPPTDAEMVRQSLSTMKYDDANGLMVFHRGHDLLPVVAAMLGGRGFRRRGRSR
jgi:hypothetical protein